MAEHWTVDDWEPTGKFAIMCREGNGYLVAILDKDNSQKQAANACLIAAAPDLLEELEEAVRWFEAYVGDAEHGQAFDLSRAKEVVAKARGQS